MSVTFHLNSPFFFILRWAWFKLMRRLTTMLWFHERCCCKAPRPAAASGLLTEGTAAILSQTTHCTCKISCNILHMLNHEPKWTLFRVAKLFYCSPLRRCCDSWLYLPLHQRLLPIILLPAQSLIAACKCCQVLTSCTFKESVSLSLRSAGSCCWIRMRRLNHSELGKSSR